MEGKEMEDVLTRCFLCARPAPTCGHCGLVGVCEAHLALHRPQAQCLPVAVVRAGVKGRMVVTTRDVSPGETMLVDTPLVVGTVGEDVMENIELSGEMVRRVIEIIEADEDMRERVLGLMDHLDIRRGQAVWDEVREHIGPWVLARPGMEEVSLETVERVVGIIRTNSIKWDQQQMSASRDGSHAYALCPLFACLNHSCGSNATDVQTSCGHVVVRAVRAIKRGEEVSIQYRASAMDSVTRRRELKEFWMFECDCERCRDTTEMGTMASGLRCDTCECAGVMLPDTCSLDTSWTCDTCGQTVSQEMVDRTLASIKERISTINVKTSASEVESILEELRTKLHKNHSLCLSLQRLLITLHGTDPDNLSRKVSLCQDYISVMSRLDPGSGPWLGPVIRELVAGLSRRIEADTANNNMTRAECVGGIKEIMGWTKREALCRMIVNKKI